MKKVILNFMLLSSVAVALSSCDKEETIQASDLPNQASTFVSTHFPTSSISYAEKENSGIFGREFKVILNDGTEIDFNKSGDWIEVDAPQNTALPTTFILPKIVSHVEEKFPTVGFNSIEKSTQKFEVELTNGIDLEFNNNGDFIRVD